MIGRHGYSTLSKWRPSGFINEINGDCKRSSGAERIDFARRHRYFVNLEMIPIASSEELKR